MAQQKIALVTGASSGIGSAVARRLARDGALVVVHYASNTAAAERVVSEIEAAGGAAFAVGADVSSLAETEAMFASLDAELTRRVGAPRIDILINSVGLVITGPLETVDEAGFDRLFDTNVKGAFFTAQKAAARMGEGGRIIFLSSLSASRAIPTRPLYGASKAAINSLAISLAQHLGPRGITVNAVMPGTTRTEGSARTLAKPGVEERVATQVAFGRIGEPDDIADMIGALVSPDGRWTTGQLIAVSGGQQL